MRVRPPALVALGAAALLAAGVMLAGPALAATTSASPSNVARACAAPTKAHVMSCFALRRTDLASALAISPNATPSGLSPANLISAYKLPSASTTTTRWRSSTPTTTRTPSRDLGTYRSQFGLPACTTANGCFRKVNQNGASSPLPASDTGWAGEISLDLDMVSAICPTCHILLVEANSASDADLYTAEDYAASQAKFVSNSWGGNEYSGQTTDDSHFNHPGVAITVSSGDSGNGSEYPATSRYVTAVGGTSLRTASNSRGWTETAWSGAGSGCSAFDAKPTWQTVTTNCTRRAEADVSSVADPNTGVAVYQTYGASRLVGLRRYQCRRADHRRGLRAGRYPGCQRLPGVLPVRPPGQPVRRDQRQQRYLRLAAVHRRYRLGRPDRPGYPQRHGRVHRRHRWYRRDRQQPGQPDQHGRHPGQPHRDRLRR